MREGLAITLAMLLFCGVAAAAHAEDWRLISEPDAMPSRMYFDADSYQPGSQKVRTKLSEDRCDEGRMSMPCDLIADRIIDCAGWQMATERAVLVVRVNGREITNDSGPLVATLSKVKKGTNAEVLMEFLCQK